MSDSECPKNFCRLVELGPTRQDSDLDPRVARGTIHSTRYLFSAGDSVMGVRMICLAGQSIGVCSALCSNSTTNQE